MTANVRVRDAGPLVSVQDLGRPGHLGFGLSPGGAMDLLALWEAAALLGLEAPVPCLEMAGLGGTFECDAPLRFALTGAPMTATIDDAALPWNATHRLDPGQILTLRAARVGTYGYFTPAGGILAERPLGSAAAHLAVGLGGCVTRGDSLPTGSDPAVDGVQMALDPDGRMSGGVLRLMPGPQTGFFDDETRDRLAKTPFRRSPRANRTGLPLLQDGPAFAARNAASPVSDFVRAGDVQITGNGSPYLMMAECQTVGGYPRIGSVISADLPRAAQAPVDAPLRFAWVTTEEADALLRADARTRADLAARVKPLVRDPARMRDLASYQLIDGVTAGRDLEVRP